MKANKRPQASITKPILKPLVERQKADLKIQQQDPTIGKKPTDPPAIYEDSGCGYNPDFTYPQE
jgi:hypothetical protein